MTAGDTNGVTLGEISRQVDRINEVISGVWRELKEMRSGFVSHREFEEYVTRAEREVEKAVTDMRNQINGAAANLRDSIATAQRESKRDAGDVEGHLQSLRDSIGASASRRFTMISGVVIAIVGSGIGAILGAILAK